MEAFKFVHAADLHLGSPFAGITARSPEIAGFLKEASIAAFRNLVNRVIEEDAKFLLVAGDVFDLDAPSLRARLVFAEEMNRLDRAGIPVFVVFGNHDPVGKGIAGVDLPPNVRIFGAEGAETVPVVSNGETLAVVSGISYAAREETRNLAAMLPRFDPGLFSAGLVHANVGAVGGYANYAACTPGDLAKCGARYIALGHVHERRRVCENPLAAYPGNIQGRSFAETGPRGALLVSVDSAGRASEKFVVLDSVRFSESSLDVSALESFNALFDEIVSCVGGMAEEADGRGLFCRLRLSGRSPLHSELGSPKALEDLLSLAREHFSGASPFIWVEEIASRVSPVADLDERRAEGGLFAQVLAIAEEWEKEGFASAREALSGLYSSPKGRDALFGLSESETAGAVSGAVLLCMDLLEGAAK